MRRVILAAALAAAAVHARAACVEKLAPSMQRKLPQDRFLSAHSTAWLDDDTLLIGSRNGIFRYAISKDTSKTLVTNASIPNGLPAAEKVHTDGKTLVAFATDRSDIAFDLKKENLVHTRRTAAMLVSDLAVRGDSLAVLGFPMRPEGDAGPLWIGKVGADWDDFKPLQKANADVNDIARFAIAPYGGAVLYLNDGTIAAISPSQPGILRYKANGSPLPRLGSELHELVIPKLPDVVMRYGTDVAARYTAVINQQAVADDLINTSEGLAIVVRRWENGTVWWELWFPDAKKTKRRIRLGLEDKRTAGGYLRCDGRGARIACMFGAQTEYLKPDQPYLVLFNLKEAECR